MLSLSRSEQSKPETMSGYWWSVGFQ